jgi:hypothetical protein
MQITRGAEKAPIKTEGIEKKLREGVGEIEKKDKGMFEKSNNLTRTRRWLGKSIPSQVELPVEGNQTQRERRMPEACKARKCTP